MQGVNSTFILTGYTVDMLVHGRLLIDGGITGGCTHFIHLGVPEEGSGPWLYVNFATWHLLLEKYIEVGGFHSRPGIQWTHLRPHMFLENLIKYGGIAVTSRGEVKWPIKSNVRIPWTNNIDIGRVVAAILANPDPHINKTYPITSVIASSAEIVDTMTSQLKQQFKVREVSPDDIYQQLVSAGAEPVYMRGIKKVFEEYSAMEDASNVGQAAEGLDIVQRITGQKPFDLQQFIQLHAQEFLSQ